MIIEIDESRVKNVAIYAHKLNSIKQHQCRPFTVHMTYEEILKKYKNLIKHPTDKLLACVNEEGQIQGVLGLFTELQDKYLQAEGGIYAIKDYQEIGKEFLNYLEDNYPGHKMIFGFPQENIEGIELMETKEFELVDSATVTQIHHGNLINHNIDESIILLTEKWYDAFIHFSKQHEENCYWTGDKIVEHIDEWQVHLLIKNDVIVGCIQTRIYNVNLAEVFGVNILDKYKTIDSIKSLLTESCKKIFDEKIKKIIMFVDSDLELSVNQMVGFSVEDTHLGYKKIL